MSEQICVVFAPGRSASARHHVYHHLASFEGQSVQCYALLDDRPDYLNELALKTEFSSFCDQYQVGHVSLECVDHPFETMGALPDTSQATSIEFLLMGGNTEAMLSWYLETLRGGQDAELVTETELHRVMSVEEWAQAHGLSVNDLMGGRTRLEGGTTSLTVSSATIPPEDPTRLHCCVVVEGVDGLMLRDRRKEIRTLGTTLATLGLERSIRIVLSFPDSDLTRHKKTKPEKLAKRALEFDGPFIGDRRKWLKEVSISEYNTSSLSTISPKNRDFFRIEANESQTPTHEWVMAYDRRNPHRSNLLLAQGLNWMAEPGVSEHRCLLVQDLPAVLGPNSKKHQITQIPDKKSLFESQNIDQISIVLEGYNGAILRDVIWQAREVTDGIRVFHAENAPYQPTFGQVATCLLSGEGLGEVNIDVLDAGASTKVTELKRSQKSIQGLLQDYSDLELHLEDRTEESSKQCPSRLPINFVPFSFQGRITSPESLQPIHFDLSSSEALEALLFFSCLRNSSIETLGLEQYSVVQTCKNTKRKNSICVCGKSDDQIGFQSLTPDLFAKVDGVFVSIDIKHYQKFKKTQSDNLFEMKKYISNIGVKHRTVIVLVTPEFDEFSKGNFAKFRDQTSSWLDLIHINEKDVLGVGKLEDFSTLFLNELRDLWDKNGVPRAFSTDVKKPLTKKKRSNTKKKANQTSTSDSDQRSSVGVKKSELKEIYLKAIDILKDREGHVYTAKLGDLLIDLLGGVESSIEVHKSAKVSHKKQFRHRLITLEIPFSATEKSHILRFD